MEQNTLCVVCGDSSDGIHFRVESCRACAAFFRRTIALNKVYKCAHQDDCAINKSVRCMCRSCRLKKCLTVGMDKEAVQPKRDAIGKHKSNNKRRHQVVQLKNDHTQDVPAPYTKSQNHPIPNYQICSPIAQSTQLHSLPYLSGMQIAYRNLLERRRATHGSQTIQGLFDNDLTEYPPANIDSHMQCNKKEFGLVSEMMNDFGHFRELPIDQKCAMFKRFYIQFLATERAYNTLKAFGVNTTKFLLPNRSFVDGSNLAQFFVNGTLTKKDPQGTARIFSVIMDPVTNNLLKPMNELNITEIELLALFGQQLWSTDSPDITAETSTLAMKIRDKIFLELQAYYADIQVENSFVRFGNLMRLIPAIHAINATMRENMRMIKIFDMIEIDAMYEEVFSP